MPNCTPELLNFSRRLHAHERAAAAPESRNSNAFAVCARLRQSLAQLMGTAGFRALLARAHALAAEEVQWLGGVKVLPDGSLDSLAGLKDPPGAKQLADGEIVLVAHLLALLHTFIGPALTENVVRDIWPALGRGNTRSRRNIP